MCSGSVIHAMPHQRHAEDGRPAQEDAVHRLHDARRLPGDHRHGHSVRRRLQRLLLERFDHRADACRSANHNPVHRILLFIAAAGGAAITAFYMFRLWYMTFIGKPRDHHVYEHAHESPKVMYVPLVILAVFAFGIGWPMWGLTEFAGASPTGWHGGNRQRRGHLAERRSSGRAFEPRRRNARDGLARSRSSRRWLGFLLATVFYAWRLLNPEEVQQQFSRFTPSCGTNGISTSCTT